MIKTCLFRLEYFFVVSSHRTTFKIFVDFRRFQVCILKIPLSINIEAFLLHVFGLTREHETIIIVVSFPLLEHYESALRKKYVLTLLCHKSEDELVVGIIDFHNLCRNVGVDRLYGTFQPNICLF